MAGKDKGAGVKSAYELALERLDAQGIARPREEALSGAVKGEIAAVRQKAEARLAELEILHRDRLTRTFDPAKRDEEDAEYLRERRRIEEERDRKIERAKKA
jgi:hypothetical protein